MKIVVADKYQDSSAFLMSVPQLLEEGRGEPIYQSRNQVWRLEHNGMVYIVKQFKKVNPIQQVVYTFFRPTKAERAFRYAEEFRKRGISTPREIAFIEKKQYGLFSLGYFICEEVRGRETHLDLREVEVFEPTLADAVAQQVVDMHGKGILHGDLNLTNFLYERKSDGRFTFTMIDLNRSHFTNGWPTDEQCLKNMVRLTHRRDLYEYLVRRYADIRGWNADDTVRKALSLLDGFEHRWLK